MMKMILIVVLCSKPGSTLSSLPDKGHRERQTLTLGLGQVGRNPVEAQALQLLKKEYLFLETKALLAWRPQRKPQKSLRMLHLNKKVRGEVRILQDLIRPGVRRMEGIWAKNLMLKDRSKEMKQKAPFVLLGPLLGEVMLRKVLVWLVHHLQKVKGLIIPQAHLLAAVRPEAPLVQLVHRLKEAVQVTVHNIPKVLLVRHRRGAIQATSCIIPQALVMRAVMSEVPLVLPVPYLREAAQPTSRIIRQALAARAEMPPVLLTPYPLRGATLVDPRPMKRTLQAEMLPIVRALMADPLPMKELAPQNPLGQPIPLEEMMEVVGTLSLLR
mmetsp:Transcript_12618/g.26124  ORF Transcript_12618/g.26124 Transcript_12618/m.26124 type:complete len:327 (+) Transcript_12618:1212-2192(+)